jgi:methylated-DNA-[protein]-cysteine S-methyltransferase
MTATATLEATGGSTTREAVRRHAIVPTELGDLTLVADASSLVGVYFPDHRPAPATDGFGEGVDPVGDPVLEEAAAQVVDYLTGRRTTFDLPLALVGSERARQVWDLIAAVPRGETTSYAALGRTVGVGPRAAGQFVARNPLCVIVPCHRVVASDGRLTGYAGGIDRKRQLLELEGALAPPAPPASVVTPDAPEVAG